ncbi:unnamed protein product [Discula destructiva]
MGSQSPPPPAIAIRTGNPADAPAIRALGTAVFSITFKASGCTEAQLQAYLDEAYTPEAILATLTNPSAYHTLVAVDASSSPSSSSSAAILGFALLNRASTEPVIERAGYYPRPVELQRLYVGTEAHGRGVGKALMRAAEAVARDEMGYETMWLGVWEGNEVAKGLYGKLGFERVGEHVFDVGGDLQTDWILVKAL